MSMRARLTESSAVPDVLSEPLIARLSRPSVDVRVAQVAATIGLTFEGETLATILGRSAESTLAAVEALVEAADILEQVVAARRAGVAIPQVDHQIARILVATTVRVCWD